MNFNIVVVMVISIQLSEIRNYNLSLVFFTFGGLRKSLVLFMIRNLTYYHHFKTGLADR